MLGKVIKYEWKSTYKVGVGILIAMFVLGIISTLVAMLGFGPVAQGDESMVAGFSALISAAGMFAFIMLMSGMMYAMYIYLGVRFHKSMYGKEGYLTQTLPVTSHQLLISKVFIGGLWISLISVAFTISIFMIVMGFVQMTEPDINWSEIFSALADVYPMVNEEFKAELGISLTAYMVVVSLTAIISPYAVLSGIFGSITMGQLFRKHKGVMGLLCCFLYFIVYYILLVLISIPEMFAESFAVTKGSEPTMSLWQAFSTIIVLLIMGVAMYFLAHYVNTKKLNME